MDFFEQVMGYLKTAEGASVSIAVVLEFVFRLKKTEKALSLLHVAASVFHKVGSLAEYAAKLLDKVLPQKIEVKE